MKSSLTEKWIVCRICLKQPKETMQTIFDKSPEKDLTQMILECGGVPIKQFDHYPDRICEKCLKYLHMAYKFRITCQRSHKHLSRFIAPVSVEKNDESVVTELELEEGEEIALKLEPEEDVGIKQEYTDEDVVDVYEPMDEDAEAFEEFYTIDREATSMADDIEFLEEIDDNMSDTSDEDYVVPSSKSSQKKTIITKAKASPKLSPTKSSTQKPTTSRMAAAVAASSAKKGASGGAKRGPKPKKFKETSYICDVCGNIYPSQGRLTEHIKLHKGIKPHECEICGHCFAQTQQLTRHMNTHTGNRPYKCNYCPAAFADLSTRNKHHRIHTNERPYVCDVCGKSFTYTNTLKFHKMIHTGEKPFVCDICGKGFQQAYKLRNHKLTHEKKGVKLEKIEVETIPNYQEVNVATAQILEI